MSLTSKFILVACGVLGMPNISDDFAGTVPCVTTPSRQALINEHVHAARKFFAILQNSKGNLSKDPDFYATAVKRHLMLAGVGPGALIAGSPRLTPKQRDYVGKTILRNATAAAHLTRAEESMTRLAAFGSVASDEADYLKRSINRDLSKAYALSPKYRDVVMKMQVDMGTILNKATPYSQRPATTKGYAQQAAPIQVSYN